MWGIKRIFISPIISPNGSFVVTLVTATSTHDKKREKNGSDKKLSCTGIAPESTPTRVLRNSPAPLLVERRSASPARRRDAPAPRWASPWLCSPPPGHLGSTAWQSLWYIKDFIHILLVTFLRLDTITGTMRTLLEASWSPWIYGMTQFVVKWELY